MFAKARSHLASFCHKAQLPGIEKSRKIMRPQVGSRSWMAFISLCFNSCSGIWDKVISSALESLLKAEDSVLRKSPLEPLGEKTSQFSITSTLMLSRTTESELARFLDFPTTFYMTVSNFKVKNETHTMKEHVWFKSNNYECKVAY